MYLLIPATIGSSSFALQDLDWNTLSSTYLVSVSNGVKAEAIGGYVAMMYRELEDVQSNGVAEDVCNDNGGVGTKIEGV